MNPPDRAPNEVEHDAESQVSGYPSSNAEPDATLADASAFSSSPAAAAFRNEPASIGPYRLLRRLGEGGMGSVWLAEQTAPVKREVAIKLIRSGRFSANDLKRFELERQIWPPPWLMKSARWKVWRCLRN